MSAPFINASQASVVRRPNPIRWLLTLSPSEATFARRGFAAPSARLQMHFEVIGQAFIVGYNTAVLARHVDEVRAGISRVSPDLRGFAAEGSAMGIAVVDAAFFWRAPNLPRFLAEFERDFMYLCHVGCGWAMARLPWRRQTILKALDPLHKWLAFDGIGFHDTYFQSARILRQWRRITRGYESRAYDQGIGRALWFVCGGSVERAIRTILEFPAHRRGDLWSGLGLAMTYAGPEQGNFAAVLAAAGVEKNQFAQGVAFACEARARAGNVPIYTGTAALAVANLSSSELACVVRELRERLCESDADPPKYEIWRRSLSEFLARSDSSP